MPSTPRRLPSGSWNCYAYLGKDAEGKRIQRSVTRATKAEARAAAVELEQSAPAAIAASPLTLGEAITKYLDSRKNVLAPNTVVNHIACAKNNLGLLAAIPIKNLTSEIVQEQINILATYRAPKTIKNFYGIITSTLKAYAPNTRLTVQLPKSNQPPLVIPTLEEITAAIREAERRKNKELVLAITMAAELGLRRGEICALTFADVQDGLVRINKSYTQMLDGSWGFKPPKTNAGYRVLPQTPDVAQALSAFSGAPDERVIKQNGNAVNDAFQRIKKAAGLNFRFHDLRHYNVSVMVSLGVPMLYIVNRIGHEDEKMVMRVYGHIMAQKQEDINSQIAAYFEANSVQKSVRANGNQAI